MSQGDVRKQDNRLDIEEYSCPECGSDAVIHTPDCLGLGYRFDVIRCSGCGHSAEGPNYDIASMFFYGSNPKGGQSDWQASPKIQAGDGVDIDGVPHVVTHTSSTQENGPVGRKDDDEKLRYHVMPDAAEQEVLEVLNFGADRYGEFNWKNVSPLNTRYYNAMRRHVAAFRRGERIDSESGKHHLAHAVCCLMFMLENDIQQSIDDEPVPAMLQRQAD